MRFPPEFLDRLRNHLPISEVVGKRVPIRRHGREFQALCPFHAEKSPSFTVSDEKGFFHCFGCGAHGDAIGFIKDFEGISYPEAIERLAIEAGLPLPKMTREAEEIERKRHTLEEAVVMAARWFSGQLAAPQGKEARDYLLDRGLTGETIERFNLGYAPHARDALKSALLKQGVSEAMQVEAGLLAAPDEGAPYDRFRGRLMFPIKNARGAIVAFGGRILASAQTDRTAKYLNSPETPLFKKGDLLFAYDVAAKAAREKGPLIIAEGYMDVIALHQAGFATAVAPLGTAITEAQLKLAWRVTSEPILCMDGDAAGLRAMQRAAELALSLLKPGFSLRFAALPAGEDPDSLIRTSGAGAMEQALGQARVLSRVLWEQAVASFGSDTAEKKAALEQHLMQTAERIGDSIVRQHMRDYFREQIFAFKRRKKGMKPPSIHTPLAALPAADDDESHLKRLENQLAAIVLLHPNILHQADIEEHFGHMELVQAGLDNLRVTALEVCAGQPYTDSDSLRHALAGHGHGEKVDTLLHKNAALSTALQTQIRENPAAAMRAFAQTYSAYTMKKLEHEKHEAERAFAEDMSEKNYERFRALQKQLEEIERTRYLVTPDEQAS